MLLGDTADVPQTMRDLIAQAFASTYGECSLEAMAALIRHVCQSAEALEWTPAHQRSALRIAEQWRDLQACRFDTIAYVCAALPDGGPRATHSNFTP